MHMAEQGTAWGLDPKDAAVGVFQAALAVAAALPGSNRLAAIQWMRAALDFEESTLDQPSAFTPEASNLNS